MRRAGFRFCRTFTRFRLEEGRLTVALGFQDLRLFFPFRFQDFSLTHPFGFKNIGTLGTLGLHLRVHGSNQLCRWAHVADLNACHFDPPRIGGFIHNVQQAGINAVALGEHFIQLHRAKHGTDVGHGQVDDRQLQVAHLIGRFWRINHLNKAHRIDGDVGVILGDDFLRRDIQHLLHHVDLAPNSVHERDDQA